MHKYTEFRNFITKKGAADLIVIASEHELAKASKLSEEMLVSQRTYNKRKKEAQEIGLLEQVNVHPPDDHGNTKRFRLTADGHRIHRALESVGYVEKFHAIKDLKREMQEAIDAVSKWEANFIKEAGDDNTKYNAKTIAEVGFPGEHDYSNPLALYYNEESVDPDRGVWRSVDDPENDLEPFHHTDDEWLNLEV